MQRFDSFRRIDLARFDDPLRQFLEADLALVFRPSLGTTKEHEARTARLQVRFARVTIRRPKRRTKYQCQIGFQELTQWVVETREIDPPKGVQPRHRFD